MRAWQSWMIRLARSPRVKRWMQSNRAAASLAGRFVGGADAAQAIAVARDLRQAGFATSLYYLGEYVEDPAVVAENGRQKIAVAESLHEAQLQIHVSINSTQIGFAIDERAGEQLALRIGARIRDLQSQQPGGAQPVLMLNMEDAEFVDRILGLRGRLLAAGVPVAQTLQAYLETYGGRSRAHHRDGRAGAAGQRRIRRSASACLSVARGDRRQLHEARAHDAGRGGEGERLPPGIRHP